MMKVSENVRGAVLMTLCMWAFATNDACMRAIAGELPVAQAVFIRAVLSSLALIAIIAIQRRPVSIPRGRDRRLIIQRSFAEAATGFAVIISLYHMELASFTSIMQAGPLSIALAGAVFMGEPIGWRRLTAILVGFVGVLIIIRPGGDTFTIWSLAALAAVAFMTVRDLSSRRLSAAVSPAVPALCGSVLFMLAALLWGAGVDWVPVSAAVMAYLTAGAGFLVCAYLLAVQVMRIGDIGFVAPFRYMGLLWAIALGVVWLGERPDAMTLLGALIVVASGAYSLWRELRLARTGNVSLPTR